MKNDKVRDTWNETSKIGERRRRDSLVKKGVVCLIGLFIYGIGIAIVTNAKMGVSPISSISYALTFITSTSLGTCTAILNVVLIVAQRLMLGAGYTSKICLMQILLSVLFTLFIDTGVFLFSWLTPETVASRYICLLLGCVVLSIGMSLVVVANIVILPGEGVVRAGAEIFEKDFGTAKIVFDCIMVLSTIIVSLFFLGKIVGVREGTVIAAFGIGLISKLFMKKYRKKIELFIYYSSVHLETIS